MINLPKNAKTLGVVLCGGLSTRMGADKGLKRKGQKPWALLTGQKLGVLDIPVVYSIRDEQYEKYLEVAPFHDLIADKEIPFEGPLKGVMSVHSEYPNKDLFVLACDMVDMTTLVIEKLFYAYQHSKKEHDFFHFRLNEQSEPLCGIYTSSGLKKIKKKNEEGRLEKFSMQYVLLQEDAMAIQLGEEYADNFVNYNYGIMES